MPLKSNSDSTRSSSSLTMTRTLSLSRVPALDQLTLAHIINGETCPPIAFTDFAAFITHKEFTTENLLFVIWFRSYQHRYAALPQNTRAGIPVPSTRLGDRYSPFAYLDKEPSGGEVRQSESMSVTIAADIPPAASGSGSRTRHYRQGEFKPCAWTVDGASCSCDDPLSHPRGPSPSKRSFFSGRRTRIKDAEELPATPMRAASILHLSSLHPCLPPSGTKLLPLAEQPMREEAERAFATFLKGGGSRELGISDELRVFAKDTLKRSTAPECFLPIYEEVYHTIETQSLPHFLEQAKSNINRPKQLFWYGVGVTDFLIGITFFLLITLFVPQRNFGYRAARLPSILFTSFGAMQFYSAMCGFCSQVWGRASRQVKPWEMDMLDPDEGDGLGKEVEELEGMALMGMTGLGLRGLDRSAADLGEGGGGWNREEEGKESMEELQMTLPEGVHPLGEFVGELDVGTPPPANPPPRSISGSFSPSPTKTERSQSVSAPDEDIELTDVQLRQLAIRRATIKVPAAELAFPIPDSMPISPVTSGPESTVSFINSFSSPSVSPTRRKSTAQALTGPHTSPFSDRPDRRPSASQSPTSPSATVHSPLPPSSNRSPTADLSTLMNRFRRAEPSDLEQYKAEEREREKSTTVFGPERLIIDPRVREIMDRVVREILIIGGVVGVLTVVCCFALPMRL